MATPVKKWLLRVAPWFLPVGIVAVWQLASSVGWLSTRILPSPEGVVMAFWTLSASGELWQHLAISSWRALIGFSIGGSLGLILGLISGLSRWGERLLDTSIQMLRNVPHLALIPLVILWFGIDESAKIFLVALGTLFPIYINTWHGIRNIDRGLVEMARSYGLSGIPLFIHVILPGALPSIMVGVRFALGLMWLTLIVAETISANSGIGYLAMNAREFLQTDVVVVAIILYALLGKLADVSAQLLERLVALEPGLSFEGGHGMNTARLNQGTPLLLNAVSKHYAENIVLNQLAGLETPTAGDVLAGTTPLAEIQDDTRMMFQDARLLPWKSVIDNVGLGLKGQWHDAARQALAAVGLVNRAGEWPAALSGGQKQRVALARALIHRPGLLLLDEPLGALDALTRLEMQDLIVSLWQEHGFTVLLVTHDVSEAVAMADRVLLIEEGKIGLDLTVDIPRPRRLGSVRLAELEAEVLQRVMQRGHSEQPIRRHG